MLVASSAPPCFRSQPLEQQQCIARLSTSTRLEEENRHLSEIEVDEMLRLVRHIGAEVTAHNAMPCWVVFLVELLLDESCDIFLNIVLFKCLGGAVDGILLHILCHIGILDHGLAVRHGSKILEKSHYRG